MSFGYAPITDLALFHIYQSREEWELAHPGETCPPFDPGRQPKAWEDPAALKSARPTVLYQNVLLTGDKGDFVLGPDGKPQFDYRVWPKAVAASVNLPVGYSGEVGAAEPYASWPCRDLAPNEELAMDPMGPYWRIRDKSYAMPAQWTTVDRDLLKAIAAKLGVG